MKNIANQLIKMMCLKRILFTVVTITFFCSVQMCTSANNDNLKVKFNSEIDNVVSKYKKSLKTDKILISKENINDTAKLLHIILIEPKEIPNKDVEIELMSNELASEFYSLLVNKELFKEVLVEISYEEYNAGGSFRRIENKFKHSQLRILNE